MSLSNQILHQVGEEKQAQEGELMRRGVNQPTPLKGKDLRC
jgi:hypothetical protein